MASATLHIDLTALQANWRALNRGSETAAVVKANAYGLGATKVAETLAAAGARRFFVAIAEEGVALRDHLGPGPEIFVFAGHMAGDAARIRSHQPSTTRPNSAASANHPQARLPAAIIARPPAPAAPTPAEPAPSSIQDRG